MSREATARSVGIAKGSVTNTLQRFAASGLAWPLDPALDDAALEAPLYRIWSTRESARHGQ